MSNSTSAMNTTDPTSMLTYLMVSSLVNASTNGTSDDNSSSHPLDDDNYYDNCSQFQNDYCIPDEDYVDMILMHIYPVWYEWGLIAMHTVVFVVGLIGNALVCVAVYRNHSMRTVTNYFIVNLAVADFMVILFCLPPTVLWDVTETWFMGTALCKGVLYLQTVSVAVSVLTLTFISVDRWYAICFPLRFKSTTSRAVSAIIVIWLLALAFDIPELIVLQTEQTRLKVDLVYFTQCVTSWNEDSEMVFHIIKGMLLYTCPLTFMSVAYFQIVRVLWRSDNIPGHTETIKYQAGCNNPLSSNRRNPLNMNSNPTTEGQLRSRRKAAKMLVAVVIMFALCYLPVHLLNIVRYTIDIQQSPTMVIISMLSHWLCYANSAINPVIYNFMSGKFRKEFRRTFGLTCYSKKRKINRRYDNQQGSTFICRFTTFGSTCTPRTEIVPLSNNTASLVDVD